MKWKMGECRTSDGMKHEYVTIHWYSFPVRIYGLVVLPVASFPSVSSACGCRSSHSSEYDITPFVRISYCMQSVEESTNGIGEVSTISTPSTSVWKRKENTVIETFLIAQFTTDLPQALSCSASKAHSEQFYLPQDTASDMCKCVLLKGICKY